MEVSFLADLDAHNVVWSSDSVSNFLSSSLTICWHIPLPLSSLSSDNRILSIADIINRQDKRIKTLSLRLQTIRILTV